MTTRYSIGSPHCGPETVDKRLEQLQLRQVAAAHEELVDAVGGAAAFADRPHDQALPAAGVAGGEDAGDAGHVVVVDDDVAALVELELELRDRAVGLWAEEAHGQEAQVAVEREL